MTARKSRLKKTEAQAHAEAILRRAADLEAVNLPPEAAALDRQQDIEVTRQGQKRDGRRIEGEGARRLDAFAALREGMVAGAYDAVRRFETDILIRRGENDRGKPSERINKTAGPTTDAMLMAAERIEAVIDRLPPRDWWLLMELIAPSIDRGTWRHTVLYITGESNPHAQCAVIRAACLNLRDAYTSVDRKAA